MLQIKDASKTFNQGQSNENKVFDKFNLNIKEGEFVTVIGSNGAGKSTLLNIISQTIKIDSGEVLLDGHVVSNQPEYKVAKHIARIYQNPNLNVALNMTVLENISLAMNKGKPFNLTLAVQKKNFSKIKNDLKQINLGLENSLNTKTRDLSGGQRQGLCIYMATLSKPSILLLDEHTAALDPQGTEVVLGLTQKIVLEHQLTTLMITHNMKQAIEYGNRLIMLHKGQVIIDVSGKEKQELTIEKLLQLFNDIKGQISDELLFS